jgi:hypothetical protein
MRLIVQILVILRISDILDCNKDVKGNTITCIKVQPQNVEMIIQLRY